MPIPGDMIVEDEGGFEESHQNSPDNRVSKGSTLQVAVACVGKNDTFVNAIETKPAGLPSER